MCPLSKWDYWPNLVVRACSSISISSKLDILSELLVFYTKISTSALAITLSTMIHGSKVPKEHVGIMYQNDMEKVPYSSCSMARYFRKVYLLENQEMCRCFLDFWRNLFVLNFQVTSRRFYIHSTGSLHSYVKFMFRLLHGHFPSPRVNDLFSLPWNLLPWDFLLHTLLACTLYPLDIFISTFHLAQNLRAFARVY